MLLVCNPARKVLSFVFHPARSKKRSMEQTNEYFELNWASRILSIVTLQGATGVRSTSNIQHQS